MKIGVSLPCLDHSAEELAGFVAAARARFHRAAVAARHHVRTTATERAAKLKRAAVGGIIFARRAASEHRNQRALHVASEGIGGRIVA